VYTLHKYLFSFSFFNRHELRDVIIEIPNSSSCRKIKSKASHPEWPILACDFEIIGRRSPTNDIFGQRTFVMFDNDVRFRLNLENRDIEMAASPSSERQTGFAFLPSCETARSARYHAGEYLLIALIFPVPSQGGKEKERQRERERERERERGIQRERKRSCIVHRHVGSLSGPINASSAAIKRTRKGGVAEPPFMYPWILKINN